MVAQLRDFGHPRRGWLGVRIQQVTPDIAESLGLKEPRGAMVAGVNDGGPADKAKIRNGDIILKFNGQDVKEMRTLPRIVAESEVGKDGAGGGVARRQGGDAAGQRWPRSPTIVQVAAATPGDKPRRSKPTEISGLGLKLAPITPETRDKFRSARTRRAW